jgi:hypothetical protein
MGYSPCVMSNQTTIRKAAAKLGSITTEAKATAARANGAKGGRISVRFRVTGPDEDVAEFATLGQAIAACRNGETVTVVAFRPGQGSPFWAATETFRH